MPETFQASPTASAEEPAKLKSGNVPAWSTPPAPSHHHSAHAKELPLHLIFLILSYLEHAGDLARVTRTSRLLYYMTLPRLYEQVTLHSYPDIRYINGRPEGYGSGTPFAMGLNTLVSRTFTDYVKTLKLIGEWREHDVDEYKQGRVPDNSMMLQIAVRAVLDKLKNLQAFAWELNTPPLHTVYQGLVSHLSLSTLIIRCPARRTPRPTTIIPPLPNLTGMIVYDIDPLCYPDDISLILLESKKLENLKLHWNPRMRENSEESVNLMSMFGRCVAARYSIRLKRIAIYNLYTRFLIDGFEDVVDHTSEQEVTTINSMSSSDPGTVFVDSAWNALNKYPAPPNLKMYRTDHTGKESVMMLGKVKGLERLYIVSKGRSKQILTLDSTTSTPTFTTPAPVVPASINSHAANGTMHEEQCRTTGGDYIACIQLNHHTLRHLLLSEHWLVSDEVLFDICKACPDLEQLGFASTIPPLKSLRRVFTMLPKLWAIRHLVQSGSDSAESMVEVGDDMHMFAMATELWRPEYKNLKYIGFGKLVYKVGRVVYPLERAAPIPEGQENSLNAKKAGPVRIMERITFDDVEHIAIWGMDTTEFEAKFP